MIVVEYMCDILLLGKLSSLYMFVCKQLHLPELFDTCDKLIVVFNQIFLGEDLLHQLVLLEGFPQVLNTLNFVSISIEDAAAATLVQ